MDASAREHILAFLNAFVITNRRERWRHLYEKNPRKFNAAGGELLDDLDPELAILDLHLNFVKDREALGVLYEFRSGKAVVVKLSEVLAKQPHFDAIFSIEPGKLAVFMFHE